MKNINENKRAKTFTVQTPDGKTRVFKTLRGATNHANKHNKTFKVPTVVTANCYFWSPQSHASGRRSSERRQEGYIESFISAAKHIPTVFVEGSYRETCGHVYKQMSYKVKRNGEWRSTNITGFIGECAKWGLIFEK